MPWCDDCSKFWNSPELATGGACPTCGAQLGAAVAGQAKLSRTGGPAVAPAASGTGEREAGAAGSPGQGGQGLAAGATAKARGAPWHFKLLVVGVTVYMVYRIYWLIEWLPKHI